MEQYAGQGTLPVARKATVTYQGPFDNPSQIEITWPTGMQPQRIPTFDKAGRITKTTYKLTNWQVTEIRNTNNQNQTARIETFSYTGERLKQHTQTNYFNGTVVNSYTNNFFYLNGTVDSVAQKLCFADGLCWAGFLVYDLNRRSGGSTTYLPDNCPRGRGSERANGFGVMNYNPDYPYSYHELFPSYWNPATQEFYLSPNDFQKTYYNFEADEYLPYLAGLGSSTFIENTSEQCPFIRFKSQTIFNDEAPFSEYSAYGYAPGINLIFANSFDQYFMPIYYFVLQRPAVGGNTISPLIPNPSLIIALTRFTDILYYLNSEGAFTEDDEIVCKIKYELEVNGKN
jgi:hypothetical protein